MKNSVADRCAPCPVCFPLFPLLVASNLECFCRSLLLRHLFYLLAPRSYVPRSNAGSACAGTFLANHMGTFPETGRWCHIDMAYPVHDGERATGYGVSLLTDLCLTL